MFFDAMLRSDCQYKESDMGVIVLDDISPTDWELLYNFFDPPTDPAQHPKINHSNISTLLPMFHVYNYATNT